MPRKKSSRQNRKEQLKKQNFKLPYLVLCDECKMLGYCKLKKNDHDKELYEIATSVRINQPFDLKYYTAKIPFRINPNEVYSKYAKEHLQTAYDAFHQDDFETALLHFKSVDPGRSFNNQPDYFLALTYFMLHNYEMASAHMQAYIDHIYFGAEDFTPFLDECSRLSVIATAEEAQIVNAKELVGV